MPPDVAVNAWRGSGNRQAIATVAGGLVDRDGERGEVKVGAVLVIASNRLDLSRWHLWRAPDQHCFNIARRLVDSSVRRGLDKFCQFERVFISAMAVLAHGQGGVQLVSLCAIYPYACCGYAQSARSCVFTLLAGIHGLSNLSHGYTCSRTSVTLPACGITRVLSRRFSVLLIIIGWNPPRGLP
ncbi:hypothetical protein D9M68_720110 [compost metagenome]